MVDLRESRKLGIGLGWVIFFIITMLTPIIVDYSDAWTVSLVMTLVGSIVFLVGLFIEIFVQEWSNLLGSAFLVFGSFTAMVYLIPLSAGYLVL